MQTLIINLAHDFSVQRAGLVYRCFQNDCRVWARCMQVRLRISFPLGVHSTVFLTQISVILVHAKRTIEGNYTRRKFIFAQPGNFVGP
jgi:hypothetical protein